jgi:inosine/xanthosine triphosphate pyrophosphatase family protein
VQPRVEPDELTREVLSLLRSRISVHPTLWPLPVHDETDTLTGLAARAARLSSLGLFEPVIAFFGGLFINSYRGFPGLRTQEVVQQIGPDGLVRLLGEASDRTASWLVVLAYCEPGQPPRLFQRMIRGEITKHRKNDSSYIDSIFSSVEATKGAPLPENDVRRVVETACSEFLDWHIGTLIAHADGR